MRAKNDFVARPILHAKGTQAFIKISVISVHGLQNGNAGTRAGTEDGALAKAHRRSNSKDEIGKSGKAKPDACQVPRRKNENGHEGVDSRRLPPRANVRRQAGEQAGRRFDPLYAMAFSILAKASRNETSDSSSAVTFALMSAFVSAANSSTGR